MNEGVLEIVISCPYKKELWINLKVIREIINVGPELSVKFKQEMELKFLNTDLSTLLTIE